MLRDLPVGGDACGLGEAAPALEAIDVSHTLISGWGALVRIANVGKRDRETERHRQTERKGQRERETPVRGRRRGTDGGYRE